MGYSKFMLDRMIDDAVKKLRHAETEEDKADAQNSLNELIAIRSKLTEADGESFYKTATLVVSALGVVLPLMVNSSMISRCIEYEKTGVWDHPTIKNIVGKIKIGK